MFAWLASLFALFLHGNPAQYLYRHPFCRSRQISRSQYVPDNQPQPGCAACFEWRTDGMILIERGFRLTSGVPNGTKGARRTFDVRLARLSRCSLSARQSRPAGGAS